MLYKIRFTIKFEYVNLKRNACQNIYLFIFYVQIHKFDNKINFLPGTGVK